MSLNYTIVTNAKGIENLEWLKFSCTQGMKRDFVEGTLLGTQGFERFRYASAEETKNLLNAYYAGNINTGYNSWKTDAAAPAHQFLTDFGITKVSIPEQNAMLDLDNGEYVPYDLLRRSLFYYGVYGVDIPDVSPQLTLGGEVGETLNGIDFTAGLFTYGETYGLEPQERNCFSSLILRDYIP